MDEVDIDMPQGEMWGFLTSLHSTTSQQQMELVNLALKCQGLEFAKMQMEQTMRDQAEKLHYKHKKLVY